MSGEQFLRAHGWKLGRTLWWHQRAGWDVGHEYVSALLQQAQWMALWIESAEVLMGAIEGLPALAGTTPGIMMSKLLCEVP